VLAITRDPPANAQCISFNFKFWGGIPKARVILWLANILVLFVGGLVSDKLYSKLNTSAKKNLLTHVLIMP
jgi:hypothetical protein